MHITMAKRTSKETHVDHSDKKCSSKEVSKTVKKNVIVNSDVSTQRR